MSTRRQLHLPQVPDVEDEGLRRWFEAAQEILELQAGQRLNQSADDRRPTRAELVAAGVPAASYLFNSARTGRGAGLVQRVVASDATYQSFTASIPMDDTIPQSTEGTELLTASIIPNHEHNRLLVAIRLGFVPSVQCTVGAALFRNTTADACAADWLSCHAGFAESWQWWQEERADSTQRVTFKLRAGTNGGTVYLNGNSSGRRFGGVMAGIAMMIEEYEP